MSTRTKIDDVVAFKRWLRRFRNEESPRGDLAGDVARDKAWPTSGGLENARLRIAFGCPEAQEAFEEAWAEWAVSRRPDAKKPRPASSSAAGSAVADPKAELGRVKNDLLRHSESTLTTRFDATQTPPTASPTCPRTTDPIPEQP